MLKCVFPPHFSVSQLKPCCFPSKRPASFLILVLPISQFYSNLLSVKYTFGMSLKCIPRYLLLSFHTQVFCAASAGEPTHHSAAPCTAYHRWTSVIRLEYGQHAASSCDLSICHTTSLRIGFKVSLVDCVHQADASLYRIQISHLLSAKPDHASWMGSNCTADLFINSPQ